ncbi:glycosyltransferase [bacterium]|nr:glycosyltransferase [bacterium]
MLNKYPHKLISVIVISFGRKEEIKQCLRSILSQNYTNFEVILVDNNEDKKISEYIVDLLKVFNDKRIRYFKTPKNLGVAGGRNFGIKKTKGDVLIFIDDDAFFEKKDAFQKIYKRLMQDEYIGTLSFKIINYYTKKIERRTFPHINKKLNSDKEFETTYFLGGGCAIRKEVFDRVGLYSEDLFYGMEELDLSFRALDANYKIFYFPQIVVSHKKSSEGRLQDREMWQKMLENRIRVAIRNLPWRYVFISSLVWTGKVFLETRGDISVVFKSFGNILKSRKELKKERSVISKQTIKKLKELQGRLLY